MCQTPVYPPPTESREYCDAGYCLLCHRLCQNSAAANSKHLLPHAESQWVRIGAQLSWMTLSQGPDVGEGHGPLKAWLGLEDPLLR